MCPNLPIDPITAEQRDRVLDTFGSAEEFKEWFRGAFVAEMERRELGKIDQQAQADKRAARIEIREVMPKPPEVQP